MTDESREARLQTYVTELQKSHMAPYWDFIQKVGPAKPPQKCAPVAWSFDRDIRPHLMEAGSLISAEQAERRVLMLNNPTLPVGSVTHTLCACFQLILPGEAARPHRHMQAAFRLIIDGDGAHTTVNGERVVMRFGDLVITPSWHWHEHANDTDHPIVWFDGLDQAMVGYFGANFHESGVGVQLPNARPVDDGLARYGSGLLPLSGIPQSLSSPVLSYPYERTRDALQKMRQSNVWDQLHGLKLKHSNPLNGDYVLPTIATFAQLLPKGFKSSMAWRATESSVSIILEGRGRTRIEDQTFEWGPRDIVVTPNWCWTEIEADDDAIIFNYSDRAALEKLGFWREERRPATP